MPLFFWKGYLHISYHIVTYKIHIVLVQWLPPPKKTTCGVHFQRGQIQRRWHLVKVIRLKPWALEKVKLHDLPCWRLFCFFPKGVGPGPTTGVQHRLFFVLLLQGLFFSTIMSMTWGFTKFSFVWWICELIIEKIIPRRWWDSGGKLLPPHEIL